MTSGKTTLKPTPRTYNLLYAKSGNRCAYPGCPTPITHEETLVGEVAHIRAENAGGPRYDIDQTPEERRAHPNLVLMCNVHHKIVDDNPAKYSAQVLEQMKANHEASATPLSQDEVTLGAVLLIQGDITVNATHISNSIVSGVYQEISHHYNEPSPTPTPSRESKLVQPQDGRALFRLRGQKIGTLEANYPFGKRHQPIDVVASEGPYFWFHLYSTVFQDKQLRLSSLEAELNRGAAKLGTIMHHPDFTIRAQDGIGRYLTVSGPDTATAFSFLFRSGEIWVVETHCFNMFEGQKLFYYSEIERGLKSRLPQYGALLTELGVQPPFKWIAGIEGAQGCRMTYDLGPGRTILEWPRMRFGDLVSTGNYSPGDDPYVALEGLFADLFDTCGMEVPTHLRPIAMQ